MNLFNKLTTARTNTLVVTTLILSAWWAAIPWISFAVSDLSNWLLSSAVTSGPHRLADTELFTLLDDIYRAWWGVGVPFFVVLTTIQVFVLVALSFYLLLVLYKRYRAVTAKLWQFLVPVLAIGTAVAFTTLVLYLSYIEVNSWVSDHDQVNVVEGVVVPEDAIAA